jgi:hypothetical protein
MTHRPEEITAKTAAERLHMDRRNVLRSIERGELTAHLNKEAPQPYWVIIVDAKFIAKEKERDQLAG